MQTADPRTRSSSAQRVRRLPGSIRAAQGFPQLSRLVARWTKDEANEYAKGVLHTIADVTGDRAAEKKADRAYGRAQEKAERSAYAILDLEVASLAEAEAKVRAFIASRHGEDIQTIPCEEDVAALAEAMLADISKLKDRARARDTTAIAYVGLKGKLDALASDGAETSDEYDATLDAWDRATDRLMSEAAKDFGGVAARLRAILEHGLCMDLDVESEAFKSLLAAPTTAEELYGPHGEGAEDREVLRRALARLYRDVEQLAAEEPVVNDFDGAAWVNAYEQEGGIVCKAHTEWAGELIHEALVFCEPRTPTARSSDLVRELSPAKQWAVYQAAPCIPGAPSVFQVRAALGAVDREVTLITHPTAMSRGAKRIAQRAAE